MIIELKQKCLETIERIVSHTHHIHQLWSQTQIRSNFPHKLYSLENDVQLLKENFTLILAKITRLQTKNNEKQILLAKIQSNYRLKEEQYQKNYRILESKYQKLIKELNFVKFSNKNLRNEIQLGKQTKIQCKKLKQIINTLGIDMKINQNEIQDKIHQALNHKEVFTPEKEPFSPLKQFQSKELKANENTCARYDSVQKMAEKTKKKKSKEQFSTPDKKKRQQLAKLVEQQGKLTKFRQKYLSTDLL